MKPGLLWRFQFWAKRSLIFGSVFCFGALLLRAEVQGEKFEEISEESNLEELLQFAAKNSFELEAAFEDWRAALERVPQARSLPDPELTYGYFVRRMETRQLVSVSQMFPWFGKLKLGEGIAEKEAAAAAAEI